MTLEFEVPGWKVTLRGNGETWQEAFENLRKNLENYFKEAKDEEVRD